MLLSVHSLPRSSSILDITPVLNFSLLYFLYVSTEKAFLAVTTEVVSKDFATDA